MPFSERKDLWGKHILNTTVSISLFFVFCTLPLPSSFAATVNLAWNSSGPNAAGYKVHYGTASRNYAYHVNVGNHTTCSLSGLTEGKKYYFAATAYNSSNAESAYSTELSYTIPTTPSGSTGGSTPPSTGGTSGAIVVDNGGPGTKASGTWKESGGPNYYGTKSVYSDVASSTYSFEAACSGSQKVSLWWTYYKNRYTKVPVKIYDGSHLLDTIVINQLQNGGKWNLLGTYTISGKARVVVVSQSSSSTTSADAAQFASAGTTTSSGSTSGSTTTTGSTSGSTTTTTGSTSGSTTTTTGSTSGSTTSGTGGSAGTIIIDNGQSGTKATGTWTASGGSNYYGTKSVYSNTVPSTYSFEAACSGSQEVYLWWTYYKNRYSKVPVKIYNGSNLLDTIIINQLQGGGQWNLLGTYTFSGKAKVVIFSDSSTNTTSADAVRLVSSSTSSSSSPTDDSQPSSGMLVIDNGDPGTNASGTWKVSGGLDPFGTESLYSNTASDTYSFETSLSGEQEVYLWWTEYSNRCTNVSVKVFNGTRLLETVKNINQQQNGGEWNALGTYTFSGKARVTIISAGGCTTSADAVSFFTP